MSYLIDESWHRVRVWLALLVLIGLVLVGAVVSVNVCCTGEDTSLEKNYDVFQPIANDALNGKLATRSDGLGMIVPAQIEKFGVCMIFVQHDAVFFEGQSYPTCAGAGWAYCPAGIQELRKCNPPTGNSFKRVTELENGWFEYVTGDERTQPKIATDTAPTK